MFYFSKESSLCHASVKLYRLMTIDIIEITEVMSPFKITPDYVL